MHVSVAILVLPLCSYQNFLIFPDIEGWGISPRGAGYLFGSDVVQQVPFYSLYLAIYTENDRACLHHFYSLGQ